ncbi:MAG: energy-coupling factor transporter ATPase [Deltaproteobacteria bacterium]|nr:energy-coupling factor transporter ATPase [Deltaproteobacteria bacterium]MBW2111732.1 energy-coupling factor transporter ATPase [Deltaproteobacteria bacterium]
MIRVEELCFQYDPKQGMVLNGISVEIERGAYVGIVGSNGCGKTTFVRHLDGLLLPTRGQVWVEGMNTRDRDLVSKVRQMVGMVFQNPDNQIVGMTVEEDVAFGPCNLRMPSREVRKRVAESLELVGMKRYARRAPHTLSNGEKQLVAMAGVLAMGPRYMVFDEPTAYLDPVGQRRVLDVMGRLNSQGITIVHVTHRMDELARAHDIVVMDGGRIVLREEPARVFRRVQWLRDLGLGVPVVTELMWRLQKMGRKVRPDVFTLEDACFELSTFMEAQDVRHNERTGSSASNCKHRA